jgi:DNA-binding SARP family transcriptional activator
MYGLGADDAAGTLDPVNPSVPTDVAATHSASAASAAVAWEAAFEALADAVLVLDGDGRLLAANGAARLILALPAAGALPAARCCDLLACSQGGCVSALALGGENTQRQVQLADGASAWASTGATGAGQVVVTLNRLAGPAGLPREDLPPRLVVRALGRTSIEVGGEAASEEWLGHRPGQLLKYLVCERGRVVPIEELLEVFWPHAGRAGASSVRQAIHTLRDRLEPDRPRGRPSGYVVARPGGYELAPGRVAIDADDFEARARDGLRALQRGATDHAQETLTAAARAYGGNFLADEPYAEWALAERERLRDLAAQVLRGLAGIYRAAADEDAVAAHLHRLVELEPLDLEAQRELIGLMLRRGRHSEALRRYDLVRRRYKRTFGSELPFGLADLT